MKRASVLCIFITGLTIATVHAQTANDHAVVRDERGQPVYTASTGTCVRTRWTESHDECRNGLIQVNVEEKKQRIAREERTAYFDFNIVTLTPAAKAKLDTLSNDIKSEKDVRGARVVGFADRIGSPSYNEKLSKKRAEAVRDYLVSKGIVNASVADTRWFGASMPATDCSTGLSRPALIQCLQKDRRVEVEIDYAPEVVADSH